MSILGAPYDKKVVRQRSPKADLWDKAAEVEDDETGQKKWKFKSDGRTVPKPEDDKVGYLFYRKWWQKLLFMPKKRVEYAIYEDKGEEEGTYKDPHSHSLEGGGDHSIFQTHRNLQGKKYIELYSQDDNTKLWLAAYLTALVIVNLAGMYVITQGVQSGVAEAVAKGVNAGASAAGDQGSNIPGVGFVAIGGSQMLYKIRELFGGGE